MASDRLRVEVVLALPERAVVIELEVPAGVSLRNAVERSRIAEQAGDIDLAACTLGVFGEKRPPETLVADGDRIEIYRPLAADPKTIRRRRAAGRG